MRIAWIACDYDNLLVVSDMTSNVNDIIGIKWPGVKACQSDSSSHLAKRDVSSKLKIC